MGLAGGAVFYERFKTTRSVPVVPVPLDSASGEGVRAGQGQILALH